MERFPLSDTFTVSASRVAVSVAGATTPERAQTWSAAEVPNIRFSCWTNTKEAVASFGVGRCHRTDA